MRQLTRLYFDNHPSDSASDQYVALIDKGSDVSGNPLFNTRIGSLLVPADIVDGLRYLLSAACFFKLPVGASAIVDVYVEDGFGRVPQMKPKKFDYQVFQSKLTANQSPATSELVGELSKTLSEKYPSGATTGDGPTGPGDDGDDPTGPSGPTSISICQFFSSGPSAPCGGQTEVCCPDDVDPDSAIAVCNDGTLDCVVPEPLEPNKPHSGKSQKTHGGRGKKR